MNKYNIIFHTKVKASIESYPRLPKYILKRQKAIHGVLPAFLLRVKHWERKVLPFLPYVSQNRHAKLQATLCTLTSQ